MIQSRPLSAERRRAPIRRLVESVRDTNAAFQKEREVVARRAAAALHIG